MKVLLVHLLKWQAQTGRRSASWRGTITEQRGRIRLALSRNPSLRARLPQLVEATYSRAKAIAAAETKLPLSRFPIACPFTIGEIVNPDFFPE